ncbi:MAG: ribonuclease Z [Defluviitaleaceae bacterium]|nr:ribonuclease Z [Defluviitaleaceae bacterium]
MLDIALVGSGGMMPLPNRYLSALLLRFEGKMVLIDCGEGTQVTVKQMGWGYKTIDAICLTHFHADHVTGLPGLLLSIGHSGREEPITIYGPAGVAHVVRSLCVVTPEIPFAINFVEIPPQGFASIKIPLTNFILSAHPAVHNAPCFAYRIDIERKGKFDLETAKKLDIPVHFWNKLQKGNTIEHENKTYTPNMVMGEARKGLSVSYCTDSRPPKGLPDFIKNSDLFICEGQYGDEEKLAKARKNKHMIFAEAAKLAHDGNVGELWLTHFSPSLPNPKEYAKNAKKIFPNTIVGYDRLNKTITFEDEE